LAENPAVERVDLVTRLIEDKRVSDDYAVEREPISAGARIVRLSFGPRRYLRKESLWPYLPGMVDQLIQYIRHSRRAPDIIHGHYADAGYVGSRLARILGVPFVFTGHSLGRVKRQRLLDEGTKRETLETASVVIASTRQEVEAQYKIYDHYQPRRMKVIPPGVDVARFTLPDRKLDKKSVLHDLMRFLRDPGKPMVLAIARADERKNFPTLIRAYAETPGLQERANLILVAGTRNDFRDLETGSRRVINEILQLIDHYDLYGSAAYPKQMGPSQVPALFRIATESGGVFVNPALTEPFGLTLLEAAASGLPIVATSDGGPIDIVEVCRNGQLVEPTDAKAMGRKILETIRSAKRWKQWSNNGLDGVAHFSWSAHANQYVEVADRVLAAKRPATVRPGRRSRLPRMDRALICDLDNTLTGNPAALEKLRTMLLRAGEHVAFGVFTGRSFDSCNKVLEKLPIRKLDFLVSDSGGEIRYGWPDSEADASWTRHITHHWKPGRIRDALDGLPGVRPVRNVHPESLRIACRIDPDTAPSQVQIRKHLRQQGLRAMLLFDSATHLEVLPIRASPGLALRFLSYKLDLAPERMLTAGDSGNDLGILLGDTLGVVVGNYNRQIEYLRESPRIYFAKGRHANGILEGIGYYDFFGDIRVPQEERKRGREEESVA
jgi:sucrose-phosphate synthase